MNKLTAISNPFSSLGTNNLVNQNDPTGDEAIVVAKIPAHSLSIGSAIEFKFGGGITGNQENQNDKLQLIPHIPGTGSAAPFVIFDKACKQASNFKTEITISCVSDGDDGVKVKWDIRTQVGKDNISYQTFVTESNLQIGQINEFHFFMSHTKSTQNSTIKLNHCYAYSI